MHAAVKGNFMVRADSADIMRGARTRLQMTQAELARRLNVSKSAVSMWERGENEPSADTYIKLGNLVPYPECLDLWKRAGLDGRALDSTAEMRARELPKGKIVWIPRFYRTTEGKREKAGADIPVPAELAPNPDFTIFLTIEAPILVGYGLSGQLLLELSRDPSDPRPFWHQPVLIEAPASRGKLGHFPQIGNLSWGHKWNDPLTWFIFLSPLMGGIISNLEDSRWWLGSWSYKRRKTIGRQRRGPEKAKLSERRKREAAKLAPEKLRLFPESELVGRILGLFPVHG